MAEASRTIDPVAVTDAQGRALHNIEQGLYPGYGRHRTGGACRRMVERMRDGGWLRGSWGDWSITERGMAALKRYQERLVRRGWV